MNLKQLIKPIVATLLILSANTSWADSKTSNYIGKSNKVGITGNIGLLKKLGYTTKIFSNNSFNKKNIKFDTRIGTPEKKSKWDEVKIAESLNDEQIGKKILNGLFLNDSSQFDLTLLSERVGKNISKRDIEAAKSELSLTEGVNDKELMEILENNYLFLTKILEEEHISTDTVKDKDGNALTDALGNYIIKSDTTYEETLFWIAYHVNIDKTTLDEVYNAWEYSESATNNPTYDSIKVDVSYIAQGNINYEINKNPTIKQTNVLDKIVGTGSQISKGFDKISNFISGAESQNSKESRLKDLQRELSLAIPTLAIRGQLISRNPCIAELGTNDGASDKDRVDIFRQFYKNGKTYSKKVSSARICEIDKATSRLYFISGTKGSPEYGDQVVLNKDNGMGLSVTANWMKKTGGINLNYDLLMGNHKSGWESVILAQLGFSLTKERDEFEMEGIQWEAPVIGNIGLGLGARYNIFGRMSIMPYAMAQYEFARLKEYISDDASEDSEKKKETISSIRVPIGMRFDINICYPVQFTFGAEYVLNFGISPDDKESSSDNTNDTEEKGYNSWKMLNETFYEPNGIKRDGLNIYAGVRFAF